VIRGRRLVAEALAWTGRGRNLLPTRLICVDPLVAETIQRRPGPSMDKTDERADIAVRHRHNTGKGRALSVAFRRDCDEEHLEPKFELPIPVGPNLVTASGLAQIEARVAELEALVAAGGDSDGQEEAKRDLRYWRTRRATAQLTAPPVGDEVTFGSRVGFRHNGKIRRLDIVGDDEADPSTGRIAFSAPLARALMGACVGDLVDFAGRAEAIEVLEIAPIEE
jgi:transcription elongation GreA/GreB family factor